MGQGISNAKAYKIKVGENSNYPIDEQLDKLDCKFMKNHPFQVFRLLRNRKLEKKQKIKVNREPFDILFKVKLTENNVKIKLTRKVNIRIICELLNPWQLSEDKRDEILDIVKILKLAYMSLKAGPKNDGKRNSLKTLLFLAESVKTNIDRNTHDDYKLSNLLFYFYEMYRMLMLNNRCDFTNSKFSDGSLIDEGTMKTLDLLFSEPGFGDHCMQYLATCFENAISEFPCENLDFFCCPISLKLFSKPVVLPDGECYDLDSAKYFYSKIDENIVLNKFPKWITMRKI